MLYRISVLGMCHSNFQTLLPALMRSMNSCTSGSILFSLLQRPSMRNGCTSVISNDRGHLNGDMSRSPASPWGSFMGTWQMRRTPIQLKTRTKLMSHLSSIDAKGGSRASSAGGSKPNSKESGRGSKIEEEDKPQSPTRSEKPVTPTQGEQPVTEPSQHGSRPPTPQHGSKPPTPNEGSRPNTSPESVQGSVQSPAGSVQGPRLHSPVGSSRGHSRRSGSSRAQSAIVRSITPSAGVASRAGSAQPYSRASSQHPSRPESRMAGSGTQSPLGFRPPSSPVSPSSQKDLVAAAEDQPQGGTETPVALLK